jgi:hypothetical protein
MAQLNTKSQSEIREEFQSLVLKDLLGPAGGLEEELNERYVSGRYLVGWLAPRDVGRGTKAAEARANLPDDAPPVLPDDNPLNPMADETSVGAGSDDNTEEGLDDDPITGTESMLPNSLGMTFCVAPGIEKIVVGTSWGWYQKRRSETGIVSKKSGEPSLVWYRTPIERETIIDLRPREIGPWRPLEDTPEVYVKAQSRPHSDGGRMVTLFLVNDQDGKDGKDDKWLFQVCLEASIPDQSAGFVRRALDFEEISPDPRDKLENDQARMNYRHRVEFAVGHGTSVDWKVSADPLTAIRIWTTATPNYEVAKSQPRTIPGLNLVMESLAKASQSEIAGLLLPLAERYESWIAEQFTKGANPEQHLDGYGETLSKTEAQARTAAKRIRAGIDLISIDREAFEAFTFMNRAMHEQRLHSLLSQSVRRGNPTTLQAIAEKDSPSWYPFQLAFILINLPSLALPEHPERIANGDPTAELLWFPTGGGKTESYLGLTAFTLAMRRLQGDTEGVAVLMRYTLRLLTLQQFQRATSLICACEIIRRENPQLWGETPFRIGLWVGQANTPNTYDQAELALDETRRGDERRGAKGSLQQLTNCPWCGSKIDVGKNLTPDPETRRLITYCGDPLGRCPFSKKQSEWEGLPICIVDEEVYRLLPSLVIATVDKFAQMPWNGETGMLFGRVTKRCSRHGFLCPSSKHPEQSHQKTARSERGFVTDISTLRPPDLIIQDELHLITGPLGSLVGLYETAIDELCSREVNGQIVRPKIVVSTATIKRAGDQVNSLFARSLQVFPPRGVDAEDNFFAIQTPVESGHPGLRYVGICGAGRRLKVALIRVYVACLCAGQQVYEEYGPAADPYMTVIGYFSSIRELGGMRRLLDDDVRTRIQQMDKRGLAARSFKGGYDELTSRKTAGDIPRMLDWLEADFDPAKEAKREAERKQGVPRSSRAPADAIIATNMISVGVDVPRLGLMIVAGQPKQTAEYVQATSRVGRQFPGIVFTVHNWARPRDLSHFETFRHFHATFHSHVEPPSVTPFATGARERALAGVLASLVRLGDQRYNAEQGAGEVKERNDIVLKALETLKERAARVVTNSVAGAVDREAKGLVDYWITEATRPNRILVYKEKKDFEKPLLKQPEDGWEKFTCLNSLREVEQSSNLVLLDLTETVPAIEITELGEEVSL